MRAVNEWITDVASGLQVVYKAIGSEWVIYGKINLLAIVLRNLKTILLS